MLGDIKKTMTDDFRVINWMVSWLGDEKKQICTTKMSKNKSACFLNGGTNLFSL